MLIRRLLTTAALGAALLLTACTGDDPEDSAPADERLAAASGALAAAESLKISLKTESLPSGIRGLLSADGIGDHSPAFSGEVQVVVGGASLGAEIVSLDGKVWAKTGLSPLWAPLDPKDFGAPDPAALVGADEASGLPGLLGKTVDLAAGDKSRDGALVLTNISGTLAGDEVASLIPTADPAGEFTVTYRLTDDDELHDATLTGPFYEGQDDVTYTVAISPRDEPANIEAP